MLSDISSDSAPQLIYIPILDPLDTIDQSESELYVTDNYRSMQSIHSAHIEVFGDLSERLPKENSSKPSDL